MKKNQNQNSNSILIDGMERTFGIVLPDNFNPNIKYPLVLVFHGGGGTGAKIAGQTGIGGAGDFISVFPDGIDHHWNDGRSTTYRADVDDVKFVRQLVEKAKSDYMIDDNKIFAVGISNGGIFVNRLACEMSDVFNAVGTDVGPIASELVPKCNPSKPISIVAIQGVSDPLMPFYGGEVGGDRQLGEGGFVESADTTMKLWAAKNSCAITPKITNENSSADDTTSVIKYVFSGCADNSRVEYYIVQGMGHVWPPKEGQFPSLNGPTSKNIDATKVFLKFFGLIQ